MKTVFVGLPYTFLTILSGLEEYYDFTVGFYLSILRTSKPSGTE